MWVTTYSLNVENNKETGEGNYWTQTTTWGEDFDTKITAKN